MSNKSIHVVPSGGEWLVEGGGVHFSTHRTQEEAEKFGRAEARRIDAELVIHRHESYREYRKAIIVSNR